MLIISTKERNQSVSQNIQLGRLDGSHLCYKGFVTVISLFRPGKKFQSESQSTRIQSFLCVILYHKFIDHRFPFHVLTWIPYQKSKASHHDQVRAFVLNWLRAPVPIHHTLE